MFLYLCNTHFNYAIDTRIVSRITNHRI